MEKAKINGVELEYEVQGSGEPVMLIGTGPIADSFLPFLSEKALVERYRLISYHQRGQAGSTHSAAPVSFKEHVADAAVLLGHLGVHRAHVAGHSTGAAIALQLAVDRPEMVHSLALLEPPLLGVPSAGAFFEEVGPALEAYGSGDREGALARFLSVVCSLDWETCRTLVEKHVPGGVAQAMKDADNFFGSYLPAIQAWQFGSEQATAISQPVLSVLGTETERLFVEGRDLLHSWFPQIEDCTIEGVAHLLHLQRPEPVAQGVAEFFARHPITAQCHSEPQAKNLAYQILCHTSNSSE
jgi:pimeloyl-ACP methyl ester carboxylesterase